MTRKLQILLIIAIFGITFLFSGPLTTAEAAKNKVTVFKNATIVINGEKITFKDPILAQSGHLLLPMRAFYEAIGANVTWNKKAQVAGATLNGKSVDLTINSKTAKVDGNKVSMKVAAQLYQYRTYVPLRFVSENLDGNVTWNQKAKRVDITITETDPTEEAPTPPKDDVPYVLHINNQRIVMEDPIITKQNRNYIPADYFHHYVENSSGTWLSDDSFQLNIAGNNFVFYDKVNSALVNDYATYMSEAPFISNGKMYVPAHFVVNTLGGSVRYKSDIREMVVYLDNYLFTSPVLPIIKGYTPVPQLVPNATLVESRDLLLSDNPEMLTPARVPDNESTLSIHHVQSSNNTNEHRVFGWHSNDLDTTIMIGITIQNTSSTTPIEITTSKGASARSGISRISYEVGLTIADAVFNNKFTRSSSQGIVIQPGETKVIESYALNDGRILGFLHDLDVRPVNGGSMDYKIRTVLSKTNGDLTLINTDPVPTSSVHPRGAWEYSTIQADLPAYTIGTPLVGYNISNGYTDHLLTAETSLSQTNGTIGNIGHYGVDYKVNIPIINPTGETKTIKLKFAGRGGTYSGAVKLNGQVYLIGAIKPGTDYVEIPVTVEGYSKTIQLDIMHAGGGNLPLGVYIEGN